MIWLLLAMINKLSKKLQKALSKEQMLVFKDRNIFSICLYLHIICYIIGTFEQIKIKTIYVIYCIRLCFYKVHPVSALSKW